MSKIYVDEIAGIVSADTVAIPGHVIQVVSGDVTPTSFTTNDTQNSNNMNATDGVQVASVSITPLSLSSKILVHFSTQLGGMQNSHLHLGVFRGSVILEQRLHYILTSEDRSVSSAISTLDSPNTTNPITYSVRASSNNAGYTHYVGRSYFSASDYADGQLILMEIAG